MDSTDRTPTDPATETTKAGEKPVAETVAEQANVLQEEAKAQAKAALDEMQAQAQTTFDKSRRELAKQAKTVSRAFRGGGESLREHRLETFATYPEQIAERIDDVSDYLRERDGAEMRRDFERTLEREPALVLGGLAALGAAGMWYLKQRQRRTLGAKEASAQTTPVPSTPEISGRTNSTRTPDRRA